MKREQLEAKWDQVKGLAKEKWGRLTDDDILAIKGKGERLKGKLRERYGLSKERAEEEMDTFFGRYDDGKVGYLVLWLMGAPAGLLILLWLLLGNNIFGAG